MLTASQIIERLGGAASIATAINAPLTTVASWGAVNFIPRWWHNELLAMASRGGHDLSTADFPTRDQRVPRAPKQAAAA